MKVKLFHGTHIANLTYLKNGSWITESFETAKTFGKYVYALEVDEIDVNWNYLSAEMYDWDTNGNGEWRGTVKKKFL